MTTEKLVEELKESIDSALAEDVIEAYVEMQRRFIGGDWGASELNAGRLCEAVSRALYELDAGIVTHSQLPGKIRGKLTDNGKDHKLNQKDRSHMSRVIGVVYKFRSDRDAVHISQDYTVNGMDSMFILHAGKWLFAELLRIAWRKDREVIADVIAQIVQVEHPMVHVLEGEPLILDPGVSGKEEVLLLLNHADSNRLSRSRLQELAQNNTKDNIRISINRLIENNEIRTVDGEEVALTTRGEKHIREDVLPKYQP